MAEIAPGVAFHFHHLGFDYRVLESMLRARFQLVNRWFSPFPAAGAVLNSEVYFLLKKAQPTPMAEPPGGYLRTFAFKAWSQPCISEK